MSRSLGQIATAAEQAKALIAAGSAVLEIPTNKIDGSFVTDRFGGNESDHQALVESIRESGQQVPILVRPHLEVPDRYQIAYGHRRVRALTELGRPVRAVVKPLTDEELVVAQGQENSARTDLSYIERARFAMALAGRGFDRTLIMSALNMEKTQLSRLMSIGRLIPAEVADAIGPAPKAGRPRWELLAERFENIAKPDLSGLLADPGFRAADTDTRFNRVLDAMSPSKPGKQATAWKNDQGEKIAVIERSDSRVAVVIRTPEFGEYIAGKLPELYRAFQRRQEG
jgi:ParB family chromosome partitioning protein